jgi:DNA-binding NarL/FixJ family response regulator
VKIRVAVVDDHALFRAGLISLLQDMPDLEVVGEAEDGSEAVDVVYRTQPDVLLLDVNMPGMGGVAAVKAIRNLPDDKQCRILMLTISKSDDDLMGAIAAGADGYLLKSSDPDELSNAIELVHQGMSILSPQITRQVLSAAAMADRDRIARSGLSEREMEVLECLGQGNTTAEIAEALFISDNTVKTHVRHILEKLDASNRSEAVIRAIQMGLLGNR